MPRDLFGTVTDPPAHIGTRSRFTLPLSLAAHAAALAALIVVPLVATDVLPLPDEFAAVVLAPPAAAADPPRRFRRAASAGGGATAESRRRAAGGAHRASRRRRRCARQPTSATWRQARRSVTGLSEPGVTIE